MVCGAFPEISLPAHVTLPVFGRRNPQMVFINVDLPAPFRPIRPLMWPALTDSDTLRRTSMSPMYPAVTLSMASNS
ncbi:hypothetical protein D3C81_2269870 [compost metagenome]